MRLGVKKSAEMFGRLRKKPYLRGMERQELYVITAKNRLTGLREELSGPMDQATAETRLARELESRRRQRYLPWTHLQAEPLSVVRKRRIIQLQIEFKD